jgi:uncharacterized protein
MNPVQRPSRFLTAKWLHLAMLNYEIDPRALRSWVPEGTELDAWQGTTFVSVVGFLFRDTRLLGVPIPLHQSFEEVNLRFYVRRKTQAGWRRGVVFIKEFAPRHAVAWTARLFFGENYATVPMGHRVELPESSPDGHYGASYWWQHRGCDYRLDLKAITTAQPVGEDTHEQFITEQYWGYSGGTGRPTIEYRVDHPRWNVAKASHARFDGDVASLYGQPFVESLTARPVSALLSDGSAVTIFKGQKIDAGAPDAS